MSAPETPVLPVSPPAEEIASVPTSSQEEADIFPQPTSMDSESEHQESDASSETGSGESSTPQEMREWIEKIDDIQYYFQADDYDLNRSFNFFKDSAGNTLKITEFMCGDVPYININNDFIISRKEFLSFVSVTNLNDNKDTAIIKFPSSMYITAGVPVNLIAEALMVLGDETSEEEEEGDSTSDERSDATSEVNEESQLQEKSGMNASQQSVVNFLRSFFVVFLLLKIFGGVMMMMKLLYIK